MHNKIDKSNVEDLLSLSSTQQGILFHYISEPDSQQYVEQLSLNLTGEIQDKKIIKTWQHVAMNNEILRTVFRWKGMEKPIGIVLKHHEIPVQVLDLSKEMNINRLERLDEIRKEDRWKRVDISQAPFRVTLIKIEEKQWEMIITNHHILYDGWSTGILLKEFFGTYERIVKGLEPVKIAKNKYKEFVKWCNNRKIDDEKQYWENYLEGFDTISSFGKQPYSQVIEEDKEGLVKMARRLPNGLVEEIKRFCKDSHITMATLLYTGWGILLSKYSNSKDVVFGTTISGRPPQINGIEDMMGLFINTLPLRIKNDGNETVASVLHRVDGMLKERTAYENTPLVEIQQCSLVPNKQLFDSIMVIENYPIDQLLKEMEGSIKVNDFTMVEETNYNLAFSISVFDGIDLNVAYQSNYDDNIMENILNHFENIITTIVTNSNSSINQINLLTKEEEKRLLQTFNDTKVEYPREKTLHQLFEEQVETVPNNIAVVGEKGRLTYGELNEKANQLARVLRAKGVKKDTIVGLMVDRTVEMMIGILAVLKAGGAYLPIDPQYPEGRIQFMLEDSGGNILLTQSWLQNVEVFEGEVLFLDQEIYHGEKGNLDLSYSSGDLAYIIYTSGSTGKPKGVAVEHKSLNNFINTFYHKFDKKVDGNDRCLSLTNIAFDVSVAEIFLPITYGATLVLFKTDGIFDVNQLAKTIKEESITFTYIPPSLLKEVGERLLEVKDEIRLDKMLVGVEPIKDYTMELFLQLNPHMKIINGYGPTEATICATMYGYGEEEARGRIIPIGKPLFNTEIYIVDSNNNLQPIGVAGELCIAGDGLARGYLNRPELTAEKFVDNPFKSGERMYRTGDLAKWLPDGNIEFVGRVDHQVKIRGYRIELGEVESQLSKYAGIKDAVVLAKEDSLGVKYLCGYIVAKEEIDIPELKREMGKALPSYMIPSHIIQLEKMPLTSNGKVDRRALPEPDGTIGAGTAYEAPRNEIEEKLVKIWQEILGIEKIGINHNFFELGGHSLKATAMMAKVHKALNVEIPLKDIFSKPTIKAIAAGIKGAEKSIYSAIEPVEEKPYYMASAAQRRLYTLQQFEKNSLSYNMSGAVILEGPLAVEKVDKIFNKLIERHESLRTSFKVIMDEPVQMIQNEVDFKLQYLEAGEDELEDVLKDFVKPFDLSKAPLLRVGLVKMEAEKHLLMLDMHHIISDGVSMSILIKEFATLYRGEDLEPLRIQYKDYSEWQKALIASGKMDKQREFWLNQFAEEVPVLNLMGDYPRPSIQSFEGDQLNYTIDQGLTSNLRRISRETGATMYMVLLAAFNVLLSKYSGQEDIVVGSPIAGRPHGDLNNIMGMFVNTLAMRNYPEGRKSFLDFLKEVKKNALGAFENQDYQFEELVERLNIRRDMSRNPLFDVMFTSENKEMKHLALDGLHIKPYEQKNNISKFDMTLSLTEDQDNIEMSIEYSTKIFKKETIERLYKHLINILKEISRNVDVKLGEIQLVSEEEKQQILEIFNNTTTDYPRHKSIQQLFEEQVEKTPDKIAVVYKDSHLTYRELNEKSNQLARHLLKHGVKPEAMVAIVVDRSLEMVVGTLAILKAGGAYLPIDPEYPEARIHYMLEDSDCSLILTQRHLKEQDKIKNQEIHQGRILISLDLDDSALYKGDGSNLDNINVFTDLAYVIYTSGSTGIPKGAMIEHRSVIRLVKNTNYIEFKEDDRILQTGAIVFDAITFELWGALLNGLELCLVDREVILDAKKLENKVKKNNITILWLTVSLFNQLVQQSVDIFAPLRYLLVGGDALTPKFVNLVRNTHPHIKVINGYGPTENTTFSTCFNIDGEYTESIPIGGPIANSTAYILDGYNNLLPIGVAGELCLGGDGLARGYLNRPDLTEEKFIEHPFEEGQRLYRTGDLARWLPNGTIEFLGRIDQQVKIRGYRIELGEIESQLMNHFGIEESIVLAREDKTGNKYLCGYIIANDEVAVTKLREDLSTKLPDYMIPTYIIQLPQFPLTPNGKIDRKALPEPDGNISMAVDYEAPRDEMEEMIVEIWQEVLGVEGIGINHNFFELGGHSLKATAMMAKIHRDFNVEIPLKDIFNNPTIKGISKILKEAEKNIYSAIEAVEEKEYYITSAAQKRVYTLQQLDKKSIAYNIPGAVMLEGCINKEKLEETFEELIKRHEALRTSFHMENGELLQYIHGEGKFKLQYMESTEDQIPQVLKDFIKAFDLTKAPLLRVAVVKVDNDRHLLIFDMHHIISDGTSMGILIKEFTELYRGMALEPLRIQYKDYSEWQKELMTSGKMEEQKKFWLKQFEGEVPVLNMMGDYPRPAVQSFDGDQLSYLLEEGLTSGLRRICKETGATMYMVLLAAYNVVLAKYSGQEDIVVGSPIAGRPHGDLSSIMGMFVNTLAFRNYPLGKKSFKEFLKEVKENALGAFENQDYQFEELVENLNLRRDLSRNPLFDVMFNMHNMEMTDLEIEGVAIKPYEFKNTVSKFDMSLIAIENNDNIRVDIEYATKIFEKDTIDRFYRHFENVLRQIVKESEIKLSDIQLITEGEKRRIVDEFNCTKVDHPRNVTIHRLFENQAKKNPNKVAIVMGDQSLTYQQLNEKANQLARRLVVKDVKADTIIGIMVERSFEMIIGIMAILKAGGAYLPIDPKYPADRIQYMLEDSGSHILLTQTGLMEQDLFDGLFDGEILLLDDGNIYEGDKGNLDLDYKETDLAYIIYTSGSTGKPKGVMVEHNNAVNVLSALQKDYPVMEQDAYLLKTAFTFDVSVTELFGWFVGEGKLVILQNGGEKNPSVIAEAIERHQVTHINFVPSMLNLFIQLIKDEEVEKIQNLKYIFAAGEAISKELVDRIYGKFDGIKLENIYGPTEATIYVTKYSIKKDENHISIPIGTPMDNIKAYIVDANNSLLPVGVPGELCIAGAGVTRGYINKPELTREKFVHNPFATDEKMYKTGDLVRWLADGNIEFLGRIDHQVKIRGYRIELGEIENILQKHKAVKDAVVVAKDEKDGGKYLCGYITADGEIPVAELKEYLATELPEYMIPSYLMQLENMPLNPSGKIDRKALPDPDGNVGNGIEYEAPRNETEETLVSIWQEILGVEKVGINHNFFEIGGHSLKATAMMAKIHQVLNVEIPLGEIFKRPTIKAIAELIQTTGESIYSAIEKVEEKEFYKTSPAQRRLYTLQGFDKESTGYNMPGGIMLEGAIDRDKLEDTLQQLVARHEGLRTSFKIVDGEPVQQIHKNVDFKMQYLEAQEEDMKEVINNFIKAFDLSQAPLFRAGLVKVQKEKHLLIFDMHHIISDGISTGILVKEFTQFYRGISPEPLRIQYKDYSEGLNKLITSGKLENQKKYWLKQLEGEIPVLDLIGDYPRPPLQSFEGGRLNYILEEDLTDNIRKICKTTGTTMYMVLLAAYNVLLSKYSGQEDIIVGSPIAGRHHHDLKNIMGMFVNTLVMRNFPQGNKSFKEFLEEVKKNAFGAYGNQDYQFEELVENLQVRRDISRNPLFDVMFTMQNMDMGELEIEGVSIKPYDFDNNISKFDMTLSAIEGEQTIDIGLEYATKIFKKQTIEGLYGHFKNLLVQITENLDIKLSELELMTIDEKQQLLEAFNSTGAHYPKEKTIHQLFEEQVAKTPNNIAIISEDTNLTYRQLNEKANQLARQLMEKGLETGDIVAIMVNRSCEMMIGLMAILKAGGAYLPIDPEYPVDRIKYMLEDSGAELLLTQSWLMGKMTEIGGFEGDIIPLDNISIDHEDVGNLSTEVSPLSLAYIIYTSGSTGRPKGVMVHHRGLINYITWARKMYINDPEDTFALYSSLTFDLTVTSIYAPLVGGNKVIIYKEEEKEFILNKILEENQAHIIKLTPAHLSLVKSLDNRKSSVKRLIVGGDNLTTALAREVYDSFGGEIEIFNEYGPTETVVGCMIYQYDPEVDQEGSVPIGRPADNVQIYLLDPYLKPVPYGVKGEMYISGDGVARGYLNRPELTEEKFIQHPFLEGVRMYRTGDLAKRLSNGNIEFLGRIDHQVKIRGYRIELGEIENQLLKYPNVEETIVIPREDEEGHNYLCGYIVAKEEIEIGDLKQTLLKELPEYMVPQFILQMEEMPLTSNGKIDRKSLPEPDGNILTMVEYEAPRNEIEVTLVNIWQEILKMEGIGINHNFFELGGHSLKATTMVAKIHQALNVEIPLGEIFKRPTIKAIAELIQATDESIYSAIEKVEEKEFYTTSPAQRRLYTLHQLDQEGLGYNTPAVMMLEGRIEIERLEKTFNQIIERHEILRTSFKIEAGQPVQVIHRNVDFNIQYIESKGRDTEEILRDFVKVFDLKKAPLMRVGLVKVAHEKHLMILDMHHIISDGTTMGIFIKEFAEIYRGGNVAPLRIQYKDYSEWQTKLITSGGIENQKNYWLQEFNGEVPVLNLMGDYPRPAFKSFEGDHLSFSIGEDLTNSLRKICRETGATMYMVLLSAYNVLLSKHSGQDDIVVGSPIAGRPHADLQNIMGMFVNTLALRNKVDKEKTFKDFLKEVKEKSLEAFGNQDYQFEELVEQLNIKRDLSRNPLFDVMFVMQNMDIEEIQLGDVKLKQQQFTNKVSKFDITLMATEEEDCILFNLEYSTSIFTPETIKRIACHFTKILEEIVECIDTKISDIKILTEAEEKQILVDFNNTMMEFPKNQTLQELFQKQVEENPEGIAVVFEEKQLTYGELNQRANQLAWLLREKGVKPETIVGIIIERSLEMIISILAILKSGAAYLPIDAEYPEDRINYMLEDSGADFVLTKQQHIERYSIKATTIDVETSLQGYAIENPPLVTTPENLAYIIYTSGSTGKPKGVMIEHRTIINTLLWRGNYYQLTNQDAVLQIPSFAFDSSVEDIFCTLITGGKIVLMPQEKRLNIEYIKGLINNHRVTHFLIVPSFYLTLLESIEEGLDPVRFVVVAGEASSKKLLDTHFNKLPYAQLYNEYGPTENSVCSTVYQFDGGEEKISIGKPISNSKCLILNDLGGLQPIGVAGELCVSGAGLARGYLDRPDLTAEKFVKNPYDQELMYKTGDLARWLPDGNIEFLGRIDHQVKIRGFRIELGEIEEMLLAYDGVEQAIVIPLDDADGVKYLCGYFVAHQPMTALELRQHLLQSLPDYMVPLYFMQLDQLPLNQHGKVDRKALPIPDSNQMATREYVAPRNAIETELVAIWENILGVDNLGINDNFFELGGHSLKATRLLAEINKQYNIDIPLKELFVAQTIEELAATMENTQETVKEGGGMGIVPSPQQDFYPVSSEQKRLFILNQMNPNSVSYNMPAVLIANGGLNIERFEYTINRLVQRHEILRTSFYMKDEIIQKVHGDVDLKIEEIEAKGREINEIVEEFIRPFDLNKTPLLRVAISKLQEEKYLILFDMHHIISDGVSIGIFISEFEKIYNSVELPELNIQYRDYAVWQSNLHTSGLIKKYEDYWLNQLDEFVFTELPQQSMINTSNPKGVNKSLVIEGPQAEAIEKYCREHKITKFAFMISVFKLILMKETNQRDITIGIPTAGRRQYGLDKLIGMFLNVLAIRTKVDTGDSFSKYVQDVATTVVDAQDHENYPYEALFTKLKEDYGYSGDTLFSILFNYMPHQQETGIMLEDVEIEYWKQDEFESKYDINLYVREGKEDLSLNLVYIQDKYDDFMIERILNNFLIIIEQVTEKEEFLLADLDLTTNIEMETVEMDFEDDIFGMDDIID